MYERKNPLTEKALQIRLERLMNKTGLMQGDVNEVAKYCYKFTPSLLQTVYILQCYPSACKDDPTGNWDQILEFVIGWVKDMTDKQLDKEII